MFRLNNGDINIYNRKVSARSEVGGMLCEVASLIQLFYC